MRPKRILVDYVGRWGLGDLLCSEPLVRALHERERGLCEIRWRGEPGNAAYAPEFSGPAGPDFAPDQVVSVRLFTHMPLDEYARLEALPSLVAHMASYGGVTPKDPRPRLNLGEEERWFLRELGLERLPRPIVAFCADGSDPYRAWPPGSFRELALHAKSRGATVLELGLREHMGAGIDLVGALPIRGTAAVLSACDLFVGNNSALLHYAQAAGVPVLGFFSLALPERFVHDGRLVVAVQHEDLPCIDCMTRDFAARNRKGCTAPLEAACMRTLPLARGREALDEIFDRYLADRPEPGAEGPAAKAFHAEVLRRQAARLAARGHVARAAAFRTAAAQLAPDHSVLAFSASRNEPRS